MSFRICSTVLLDASSNVAIQSYGFKLKRVLGDIKSVLYYLDIYQVDEIHLIIPFKGEGSNPVSLYNSLKFIPLSSPLSIGGGIDLKSLEMISRDPYFERIIFNSAFFDDHEVIRYAAKKMGHQAIVAYLPFTFEENQLAIYNSKIDAFCGVDDKFWDDVNNLSNEVILLDAYAEGTKQGFSFSVLDFIPLPINKFLISGGINESDIFHAKQMKLAGVSIDNKTLHNEFSLKGLR